MRVVAIGHLQGGSFNLYGSNASDTSPMTKPRNGRISPLHEEPSTCPSAFLRLNAMPVPPSCARYIPLPMNCDDDRFSPPLSTRPPPTRSPCLSSVSLIELLLAWPLPPNPRCPILDCLACLDCLIDCSSSRVARFAPDLCCVQIC